MKFAYLIEPPFNYREPDGSVTGCDVELARTVLAALVIDPFEPVETEFAALLPGVAAGRWRMTTGLFATEERRQHASFSRPIWALPDGLLVAKGNPKGLGGYAVVAQRGDCRLAVIRDQFQHRSAVEFGIPTDRIVIFETYAEAAKAVETGVVDAYASVARAHSGYLAQNPELRAELVTVPAHEKAPAFGSFAFAKDDDRFRHSVDEVLEAYIGSPTHRAMMAKYGFADSEIDLLVN
jgi:polar amino acid transport system substrate-binding protein